MSAGRQGPGLANSIPVAERRRFRAPGLATHVTRRIKISTEDADLLLQPNTQTRQRILSMTKFVSRFLKDESGATAIEYGLIAALIAVVIISAVTSVGTKLSTQMSKIASKIT
eukprot:gene17757-17974_t